MQQTGRKYCDDGLFSYPHYTLYLSTCHNLSYFDRPPRPSLPLATSFMIKIGESLALVDDYDEEDEDDDYHYDHCDYDDDDQLRNGIPPARRLIRKLEN